MNKYIARKNKYVGIILGNLEALVQAKFNGDNTDDHDNLNPAKCDWQTADFDLADDALEDVQNTLNAMRSGVNVLRNGGSY